MVRRPPARRRHYTVVKPVRFAPEEWEKILARAEEVDLPPSVYVRRTTLGYRLSRRIDQKAIYHLGRVGNNLNQLAKVANSGIRDPFSIQRQLEEVKTLLQYLKSNIVNHDR